MENENDYEIRLEKNIEHRETEIVIRESFWNVYRPGCYEHFIMHKLRESEDFVEDLNFVLVKNHRIIGQVAFVKSSIKTADNNEIFTLTMGPVCIMPAFQRQGYGKILIDFATKKAAELGFCAILIEGNIDFYKNCGFDFARNFGLRYKGISEGDDDSFFLCKELIPGFLTGFSGIYESPKVYEVSKEEVEKFDKGFPEKEKLKLPGQIFE